VTAIVSINGNIEPQSTAKVSVMDHGFLFGDSVYETLRTYNQRLFLFRRHYSRLEHSAEAVFLNLPWDRDRAKTEVERAVRAAANPESRVRLVVTRGDGGIQADPASCNQPNVLIYVNPLSEIPAAVYEEGVRIITSSLHRSLQMAEIKSGNLLRQVLAIREAQTAGAFEAILFTPDGVISDGITSNLYFLRGSELRTPSAKAGIVEGITRQVVLELSRLSGLTVVEGEFSKEEIERSDEIFLTSSTREIVPIVSVDGKPVGEGRPGPVARKLLKAYRDEVQRLIAED